MSLYTKYRPKDWKSVIGQDAISNILSTSLIQNRISHAYILTGSRGTGKTTTARIIAKGVNCLDLQNGNPCHKCAHCVAFDEGNMLDCIEIDGASNNGVENVRDLIEKARFEPNQGKYKIYIIDEVHMLSTGAFNALLKTLEEPPEHVIFILATTEIEKVPETIRSRSLRFDFKKISESDIIKRLEFVCKEEGIEAEKEALEIIARAARGGLRDALTLTEQNNLGGHINTDYVRSTLSLIEDSLIAKIIDNIITSNKEEMLSMIDLLKSRHIEVRGLFDQVLYALRDKMLAVFSGKSDSATFEEYNSIFEIFESAYSRIRTIPDGLLLIEMTLMRAVSRKEINQAIPQSREVPKSTPVIQAKTPVPEIILRTPIEEIKQPKEKQEPVETHIETTTKVSNSSTPFSYIRFLEEVKKIKATLVLDLKTARFENKDNTITFMFSKEWHYNRANDPSMKTIIGDVLTNLYGGEWNIICKLDSSINLNMVDEVF